MSERIDPVPYEPEAFLADLRQAAEAIGAPFDEAMVRRTLEVFDAELRRCVVQLKATSRPGDGLYYRFFYKWERDLTEVARQAGILPPAAPPLLELQPQLLAGLPGSTRAGLDLDAGFGIAKIWTFTGGPVPVEALARYPAVPDSVRTHLPFFARHGLKHVFFTASDLQRNSMNVYFILEEDCRHEAWLRALVADTGGADASAEDYQRMVESLAVSAGVGFTFRWDQPELGRWCLYALNVEPGAAPLPDLPPRLARFPAQAPTLNEDPQFNVAWSFGPAGFYVKLEKSYARDADHFLTYEMGGDLSHLA